MMEQIQVDLGARSYPIFIAEQVHLDKQLLAQCIRTNKVMVVSNQTVAAIYLEPLFKVLSADYQVDTVVLPDGEQYKNLEHLDHIFSALLEKFHSRDTTLIALGGGVIGDMTGFAAACYQRGVDFVQIPTTLLAQVDSSVGGKTAVNHPLGKNMIGAFYQPQSVLISTSSLSTLPEREFAAGMAEVIKYGIIWDYQLFCWLEDNVAPLKKLQPEALTHAIKRCCEIKAAVVNQDEKEHGVRALLNLGHTFGHAIEAQMGYGNWLHGEAVAAGMVQACRFSVKQGKMDAIQLQRVIALLEAFNLPVVGPKVMQVEQYLQHMRRDKKVLNGVIRLVIPTKIGHAEVIDNYDDALIAYAIAQS
ncbi:3-dehydroquinate synthase [Paraferrimonas sp. SM1919]|uniref:3-dehydroquinate synthase n=1 Tax=Paraferrimonas sp. SM1919 TaxID=2662263 RepID=UPI001969ABDB|nr:3-dehydroquinate synthase [Paraferrimonas sp. SM1919]